MYIIKLLRLFTVILLISIILALSASFITNVKAQDTNDTIYIDAKNDNGVKYTASSDGIYRFTIISGACSPYPDDSKVLYWIHCLHIFKNRPVEWTGNSYGLGPNNYDYYLGVGTVFSSPAEAEADGIGRCVDIPLNSSDYVYLISPNIKESYPTSRGGEYVSVQKLPPKQLIADFTYQPLSPHQDEMVTFDPSASTPGIAPIKSFIWNFGDPNSLGNDVTLSAPSQTGHSFSAGTYTVTLTAVDTLGNTNTTKKTITVLSEIHELPHHESDTPEPENSVTPTPTIEAGQPKISPTANPSNIIITPPGIITPNPGIITPNPSIIITPNPSMIITPKPIILPVTPISQTPIIPTIPSLTISGVIKQLETNTYVIPINTAPNSIVFYLKWPGSDLDLVLNSPNGKRYAPNNTSNGVVYYKNTSQSYSYYFIDNPEKGNWTVDVIAIDVKPTGENYSISLIDTSLNSSNTSSISPKSTPSISLLITALIILIVAFLIVYNDKIK